VIVVLYVLVGLLSLTAFLFAGALVEMFRSLEQIREYSGLIDRPSPIDLGARVGRQPGEFGLPQALDSTPQAVVLFLSDKCATCRTIASALDGAIPRGVVVVLESGAAEVPDGIAATYRFDPARTVVDPDRGITKRLGMNITPAAIVVEDGRIARATSIPSTRQLYALLESNKVLTVNTTIPSH
jgi:hypothetical protein